jgi:hypothetical protein
MDDNLSSSSAIITYQILLWLAYGQALRALWSLAYLSLQWPSSVCILMGRHVHNPYGDDI